MSRFHLHLSPAMLVSMSFSLISAAMQIFPSCSWWAVSTCIYHLSCWYLGPSLSYLLLCKSFHLVLGLHFLLPCTSISSALFSSLSSSLLITCSYYLSLASCVFFEISLIFTVPLILALLTLSSLVMPYIHSIILISATSILLSFIFFLGTVDPWFNRPRFNGLCLLADNQPRSGLKSITVKESPVGGGRIGNIIR